MDSNLRLAWSSAWNTTLLAHEHSTAESIVSLVSVFLIWPQDDSWKCRLIDRIWEALQYQIIYFSTLCDTMEQCAH